MSVAATSSYPVFSQFFILSSRGDKLIAKDLRYDVVVGLEEVFFHKLKFWNGEEAKEKVEPPPLFNIDGINFIYVKKSQLYLVLVTRTNVSPNLALELLFRICRMLKDFMGILNEESLRKNFTQVYEVIDEVFDNGYIQHASTDSTKYFVMNEAVEVEEQSYGLSDLMKLLPTAQRTVGSIAARKPLQEAAKKNEIFVDILEKVNVVFNGSGGVLRSEIIGSIIMKSFLLGNPELRFGLNENLLIGKEKKASSSTFSSPSVVVDAINFNDVVRLNEWEPNRIISLYPPDGEFTVLSYRISGEYSVPFRVQPLIQQQGPYKVEAIFKIKAELPPTTSATNVLVRIPVPKTTANVSVDFTADSSNNFEYKLSEKVVLWAIKKFTGGTEQSIRLKISLTEEPKYDIKKQIGPVTLKFEVPMHNISGVQVKFLKIEQKSATPPARWVRYISQAGSYIIRC